MQLEGQNSGEPVKTITFGSRDFVVTAGASVRVVTFQDGRLQVLEESLFNRLICWCLIEFILDRKLQVLELGRVVRLVIALFAFDKARAQSHKQVLNDAKDTVLLERLLNGVEEYPHELLHILLLVALRVCPAKAIREPGSTRIG